MQGRQSFLELLTVLCPLAFMEFWLIVFALVDSNVSFLMSGKFSGISLEPSNSY